MPKDRSFALKNMREKKKTKYTKSEKALFKELTENCFPDEIMISEVSDIMKQQYTPLHLYSIEGIRVTNPPPKLDIAIPGLMICIRVMGKIHESKVARLKDGLQKRVLEGNDWTVIDVWQWEREDLWL